MHPKLGECYILTFSLTGIKGQNNKITAPTVGEYVFDDLQFSFNVNKNYANDGCRGLLANIGTATLRFSKTAPNYEILIKPKVPWKVLIPIKCFLKNSINKIDYSFHQTLLKNLPFVISDTKSVGAINFKYRTNLEYNLVLQNNNEVTIFNPLAYRIRSKIDYLKAKITEIIIEEPLKEQFNFKASPLSISRPQPITSLFNWTYQLVGALKSDCLEIDFLLQEKLQQQYGNPILDNSVSSIFKDYYLNNNKTVKLKGVIKYDNQTKHFKHNFIDTINLNDTTDTVQPVTPKRPVLILPAKYNNWRGAIDTNITLKTATIGLTVNILQTFSLKNSIFNSVTLVNDEKFLDLNNSYYQDFIEKLIIDIEQIKWWFMKRIISLKDYQNFILGINGFETS